MGFMSREHIEAGKDHEFVILPGQLHGFGGVHDSYSWREVAAFFRAHLHEGKQWPFQPRRRRG